MQSLQSMHKELMISDNCKVELPKIIGFSCRQKEGIKKAKLPKKDKTKKPKDKSGTWGDGTNVKINVIYF